MNSGQNERLPEIAVGRHHLSLAGYTDELNVIAELLRKKREQILSSWERELRRELPSLQDIETFYLFDSLPKIFEELENSLCRPAGGGADSEALMLRTACIEHAKSRLTIPDFSPEQILLEFDLLRKAIFSELKIDGTMPVSCVEAILDTLSSALRQSFAEFNRLREQREECARERAEKSERRFLDLVDHLDHAIAWIADANTGRFVFVAKKAACITGYPVTEWLNDPNFLRNHVHPDDHKTLFKTIREARRSGEDRRCEHRFRARNGTELWFHTGVQIERNKQGEPEWLRGVCFEITPMKRALAENKHLLAISRLDLERLRSEREMRERFVSALTHDLRNPLAAAKLGAQLLQLKLESPNQKSKANRIIFNISRVDKMIQDLLDANRIRAGQKVPIRIDAANLSVILQDVIDELSLMYGERFLLESNGSFDGYWSAEGLRRVAENLIINALKYGSRECPIRILLEEAGENVRFSVHNEGEPISLADQSVLFEPFRRASSADAGCQSGWGLGLTVVRSIVDAHSGRVSVVSSDGEGTTFVVEIPRDSRLSGVTKLEE